MPTRFRPERRRPCLDALQRRRNTQWGSFGTPSGHRPAMTKRAAERCDIARSLDLAERRQPIEPTSWTFLQSSQLRTLPPLVELAFLVESLEDGIRGAGLELSQVHDFQPVELFTGVLEEDLDHCTPLRGPAQSPLRHQHE